LNNKEIIELINRVEAKSDVLEIKCNGVVFWPYLRQLITLRLFKYVEEESLEPKRITLNFPSLRSFFKSLRSIYLTDRVHNVRSIAQTDALVLIHASSRQEKLNNKYCSRTSDAITDFFENNLSVSTLEYSLASNYPQPRYRSSKYIDTPLFLYMALGALLGVVLQLVKPNLKQAIVKLNDTMRANGVAIKISPVITICKVYSILFLAKYFGKRLAQIKPKVVFIPEFYNAVSMALSLACRRSNITSVEYQHGAQNDYHRMYTHWEVVPEIGYDLMPQYFWCWGEISADRIRRWAKKSDYHKVVTGGNLWLLRYKTSNVLNESEEDEHQRCYSKNKKHILLSLQMWPVHFNFELLSVIKDAPPNWHWHIRQHPLHMVPEQDLKKYFLGENNKNVEIECCSKASLYAVLNEVDVHITGFSTVAFEAQSFNVPTIFVHENALHGFSDLIDNESYYYALSKQEINNCLQQTLSDNYRATPSSQEYIVASEKEAFEALHIILS